MREFPMRYYVWTMLAVIGVGASQAWSALQPPSTSYVQSAEFTAQHPNGETPTIASLTTLERNGQTRAPASIGTSETIAASLARNEAADYKLPCKGELAVSYPATTTQLRLTSDGCRAHDAPVVTVVNETNGFSATIFAQTRGFTTDYITLARGENHIVISTTSPNGAPVERKLTIKH